MERIPVIIDTDIGSDIDDTWALAAMLGDDTFDIKLVTTVWEDVQYKCALVRKLAAAAGKSVAVAAGVGTEIKCSAQAAWLGEPYPSARTDFEDAFYNAAEGEENITVVALGPMTNLARILAKYPALAKKIRIVAMIGAVRKGYINESAPGAECNVALDPAAFRAVLKSGVEITIAPLDVCRNYVINGAAYRALENSSSPVARGVLENYALWKRDYAGGVLKYPEGSSSILFDLLPVYYLRFPHFFDCERLKIDVTDDGKTPESENGFEAGCMLGFRGREMLTEYLVKTLTGGNDGKNASEKKTHQ